MIATAFDQLPQEQQEKLWNFLDGMGKHEVIETSLAWLNEQQLKEIIQGIDEATDEEDPDGNSSSVS